MTHVRTQIRSAVKAALIADVAAVEGRVGGVRSYSRSKSDLPAIEVRTPGEAATRMSDDGDIERLVSLEVRIIADSSSDVEDTLDAIAEPMEAALYGVWDTAPFIHSVTSYGHELEESEPGARPTAALVYSFGVSVFVTEDALNVIAG